MRRTHLAALLISALAAASAVAHAASEKNFAGPATPAGDEWPRFPHVEKPPVVRAERVAEAPAAAPADVAGRWVGTWMGASVDISRSGAVVADFTQSGTSGWGKLVLQDTNAAEGVPDVLRMAGSAGVEVRLAVEGSDVVVKHEMGGGVLTAEMTVEGDRMAGRFRHTPFPVRLVLMRDGAAPEAATAKASAPDTAQIDELRSLAFRAVSAAETASSSADRASAAAERSAASADRMLERSEQGNGHNGRVVPVSDTSARPEILATLAVAFAFDRWELNDAARIILRKVAVDLRDHPELMVNLEGHTDPKGTAEYNIGLSQRRVAAVAGYLVANGVELSRIHWVGLGTLTASGSPEDPAKQRRVVVQLTRAETR